MTNETDLQQRHIFDLPGFRPLTVFAITLLTHCIYITGFHFIIHIPGMAGHPFFNFPLVDSDTYHRQALAILREGWLGGDRPFWQAPLYPYFLAFWYRFLEPANRIFDIRFIQAVLAAINGVLLYAFAARRVGRNTAFGAALAMAFYAPLVYFNCELLAPVVVVFAYMLLALTLDQALRSTKIVWWLAAGAVNGMATLGHGLAILIVPLVCLFALARRTDPPQQFPRRFAAGFLYGFGALLLILPVTVRNYCVSRQSTGRGEFVLISHNGPINLYIGNHPDYEKMVGLRPGLEWGTLDRALDEQGIDTAGGEAKYFVRATLDNLRRRPLGVARVWVKKAWLFFHADELKRNYPIYPVRQHAALMWPLLWKWRGPGGVVGLGFPFGILLPLAVVGWWVLRKKGVRIHAIELIVAGHLAANMLFFICSRYRVAITPFLAIYAAAAVAWAIERRIWTGAALRENWGVLATGCVVFLASNAALAPMNNVADRAEYSYYFADTTYRQGEALARAGKPSDAQAKIQEALEHCRAALEDEPDMPEGRYLLGMIQLNHLGEPQNALAQFDWLLARDPGNMRVLRPKAYALLALGRTNEAREIAQALLETDPGNPEYKRLLSLVSEKETEQKSGNRTPPERESGGSGTKPGVD